MVTQRVVAERTGVLVGHGVQVVVPLFDEPSRISSADNVDYYA